MNRATIVIAIVIVPAEDVLLTTVELPPLSRNRLQQAIPFALEDQLLGDLSELHFAIGKRDAQKSIPVAVVAQQKMKEWLHLLNEQNISPAALVPVSLALPTAENAWYVFIHDHTAIVRTDVHDGFACDKNNLDAMLAWKMSEKSSSPQIVYLPSDSPPWSRQHMTINLLQGAYQPKRKKALTQKVWLTTGSLFLACVGLLFFNNVATILVDYYRAHRIESAIHRIYYKHFPKAAAVTRPQQRMQEKWHQRVSDRDSRSVLSLLTEMAKHLSRFSTIRMQQFDFRQNQLTVELEAMNAAELDAFADALRADNLSVVQKNINSLDASAKSTLLIGHSA